MGLISIGDRLCFDYLKIEDIYQLKSEKLTEKFSGKHPEKKEEMKLPEEPEKVQPEKNQTEKKKPAPGKNKKDLDEPVPVTSFPVEFVFENVDKLKFVLSTLSGKYVETAFLYITHSIFNRYWFF